MGIFFLLPMNLVTVRSFEMNIDKPATVDKLSLHMGLVSRWYSEL